MQDNVRMIDIAAMQLARKQAEEERSLTATIERMDRLFAYGLLITLLVSAAILLMWWPA